jgi:hypothetical protein
VARIRTIKPETKSFKWVRGEFSPTPGGSSLYRIYDHSGRLLYVGVSINPFERLRTHAIQRSWWVDVCSIQIEFYPCNNAALDAELKCIREEAPKHNIRSAKRMNA